MALSGEVGHGYEAKQTEDFKIVTAFETWFSRDSPEFENHAEARDFLIALAKEQDTEMLVSPIMVCKSGAGYYIGTLCIELLTFDGPHPSGKTVTAFEEWLIQPYSRESYHYYLTYDEALTILVDQTWIPRL